MTNNHLASIKKLLPQCNDEERAALFAELRTTHQIHEFEHVIGAPAEMILEAVHRAPELTRRMLRGVIADAAFAQNVVPSLAPHWQDVTPEGNYAYDYKLSDEQGPLTVQVKLQRSEKGAPVIKDGTRYGFENKVYVTETQKTRTGTDADDNKTRPYRYGEFDILAVSMQPSTGKWDRYMYTVGRWLVQGKNPDEMATMQPVAMDSGTYWTNDFDEAAKWVRSDVGNKRMSIIPKEKKGKPRKPRG